VIPTSENVSSLSPISMYGASKLASENLINAFCHMYDMKSWIFRIANVIGKDSRKGVVFDLIKNRQNSIYLTAFHITLETVKR
ncbi:MAG TPA: NAD-dependent epimerase/dehydratase family protein, partial [Flavobacteriaceae bacterium]|nr:NAD-dependent epimerase/dehydratase family protein [Flavobacteriaceae bacterium]